MNTLRTAFWVCKASTCTSRNTKSCVHAHTIIQAVGSGPCPHHAAAPLLPAQQELLPAAVVWVCRRGRRGAGQQALHLKWCYQNPCCLTCGTAAHRYARHTWLLSLGECRLAPRGTPNHFCRCCVMREQSSWITMPFHARRLQAQPS